MRRNYFFNFNVYDEAQVLINLLFLSRISKKDISKLALQRSNELISSLESIIYFERKLPVSCLY